MSRPASYDELRFHAKDCHFRKATLAARSAAFSPTESQFVLSGNVRDLQASEVAPGVITPQPFNLNLRDELLAAGYARC
ncbi:hypothetical protein BME99_13835 [Pseudomonas protegens]|nr:hypothetical protein BME99_13835 [Pseudomonas protegens]